MNVKNIFTVVVLVLCLTVISLAQQVEPKIVPQKINDNLYVLYGGNGQGANVGVLIGNDSILLIDGMSEKSNQKLLTAIRKISDKPIKFVINTHSDSDHSGGNAFFAKMGATIISQENAKYSSALTNLTFKKRFSLKFGDEEIYANHVISHSYNDLIIYFKKSNVVFMGDTYSSRFIPAFTVFSGQDKALELAISQSVENTVVVPGHGLITDKKDLISFKLNSNKWFERMIELREQQATIDLMTKDEKLIKIKDSFLTQRPQGIPVGRFKRFIERTIASEFITPYPISKTNLKSYVGHYQFEDKTKVEVFLSNGKFYARKTDTFYRQIIPVSPTRFKIRGAVQDEGYYIFNINKSDKVQSLSFVKEDQIQIANKISK